MEIKPDTENVIYMDEYRRAKWLTELNRARRTGAIAVFGALQETDAEIIAFPGDNPDDAA